MLPAKSLCTAYYIYCLIYFKSLILNENFLNLTKQCFRRTEDVNNLGSLNDGLTIICPLTIEVNCSEWQFCYYSFLSVVDFTQTKQFCSKCYV